MATDTTRVSSYIQGEGYKDASGTLLTPTFTTLNSALSGVSAVTPGMLNTMLYGAKYKVAFGTVTASNAAVMSCVTNCGISTALYAFITPRATGIIAGAVATQTGVRWIVCLATGTATEVAANYMVVGNA
jgi:hypothetical protein